MQMHLTESYVRRAAPVRQNSPAMLWCLIKLRSLLKQRAGGGADIPPTVKQTQFPIQTGLSPVVKRVSGIL